MRSSPEQRRRRVLERVQEAGHIPVTELASAFGVSVVTIRNDVDELASRDLVRRTPEAVTALDRQAPAAEEVLLGLILPNTEYYFTDIIDSARTAAARHGARMVVSTTDYDPELDVAQAEKMLADGAQGLIAVPSWPKGEPAGEEGRWISDLLERDIPVVLAERWVSPLHPLTRLDRVCTDHVHGMAIAIHRLMAQGHRNILLATQDTLYASRLGAAYDTVTTALDLPRLPPVVGGCALPAPEYRDDLYAKVRTGISQHGVTALIIHTGLDAVMLVPLLTAHGVRIPDDLAIIAYDDEVAELADVPLTTIATPKRAVGTAAVEHLIRRLADPAAAPHHTELLPELRIRQSG